MQPEGRMTLSRQGRTIIEEAQAAGCRLLDAARLDGLELFLFETAGARHLYVQPFEQGSPVPGEHHAWIHGSWPAAVALEPSIMRGRWTAPESADLTRWLHHSCPPLARVARDTPFRWAFGARRIELDWAVQVASLGDGRSHLVLQAGRYGGGATVLVGFAHFLSVAGAVAEALAGPCPAQEHVHPVRHGELFELVLERGMAPSDLAAEQPPEEHHDLNGAAGLLFEGHYEAAVEAFSRIAERDPAARATCYGQIGAAMYFMERYREAMQWYEAAIYHGADPERMGDAIADAQRKLTEISGVQVTVRGRATQTSSSASGE